MKRPILSILIPTVYGREQSMMKLLEEIDKQKEKTPAGAIEIIIKIDNKEMTIGEKRQIMYQESNGIYSWMIDDDDLISSNAIEKILEATIKNPDCITFQEHCMINGDFFSSNHSIRYDDWGENQDGFSYVRTPFMKDVIRTEIAKSVPISFIRYGEDHLWAKDLKPHLKTEVHIDEYLYFYIHNSKPENFNERYGYDRG